MDRPQHEDTDALRQAERQIQRLETALRVHRIALCVAVLLLVVVLSVSLFGQRKRMARAIVIDDEVCCLVATHKEAEAVRQRILAAARGALPGEAYIQEKWEDTRFEAEERPVLPVSEAVEQVRDKVTVLVEASAITVDGVNVAALATDELARKALDTLKLKYIEKAEGAVKSQRFEPEPTIGKSGVSPSSISTDIRGVVEKLSQARSQPKQYTVQRGDFVEKIASAHSMTLPQLYEANEGLKNRTIHPGEVLTVSEPLPALTVVTVMEVVREEPVEPPVEKKPTAALKKGETKVSSEGKAGARQVTYRITRHNDKEAAREKLAEQVTRQPEPRRVLVGTSATEA